MKQELQKHLTPLLIIFLLTTFVWILARSPWYQFIFLFLGLSSGSFFLDLDHLLYWYYLAPDLQESRLARLALSKKDFRSVLKILETTHKGHTNLIFHHYLFQLILVLVSLFVFTSSSSAFGQSFLLALNIHLLADQIDDYRHNPAHLQDWLFARASRQLPVNFLGKYLLFYASAAVIFSFLLIKSKT